MVELRNIVTGVSASGGTNTYATTPIPVGPTVDLIPYVLENKRDVQLTVIPSLSEFVGYDDPGPFQVQGGTDGRPLQAVLPMPRFQASQTIVTANIPDGHTPVISGFAEAEGKHPKGVSPKQIFVFITPTITDVAGHRIQKRPDSPLP